MVEASHLIGFEVVVAKCVDNAVAQLCVELISIRVDDGRTLFILLADT